MSVCSSGADSASRPCSTGILPVHSQFAQLNDLIVSSDDIEKSRFFYVVGIRLFKYVPDCDIWILVGADSVLTIPAAEWSSHKLEPTDAPAFLLSHAKANRATWSSPSELLSTNKATFTWTNGDKDSSLFPQIQILFIPYPHLWTFFSFAKSICWLSDTLFHYQLIFPLYKPALKCNYLK